MSYGYGGRPNPFDQRGDGAPAQQQQPYMMPGLRNHNTVAAMDRRWDVTNIVSIICQHAGPRFNVLGAGQSVEMAPLAQNGSSFGQANDPNAILNECREISSSIDKIVKERLVELKRLQDNSLYSSNSSATNQELENKSTETMAMYRHFAGRIKTLKQQPESGSPKNAQQLNKVNRDLKEAIEAYRTLDSNFRNNIRAQIARQYRIVRPEASEAEVREAMDDTSNPQIFSQALLQSDRRGEAAATQNAVKNRHAEIQKIESQMIELAQLFQDMEQLVVQQEAAVVNIEMKGEEVVENMDQGTKQIGTAIQSARNARKWKWWCLGIVVLIIIIIVVVVLIYKFVIQNNGTTKTKRSLLESLDMPISSRRVIPGKAWSTPSEHEKRMVIPGLEWKGSSLSTERRRKIKFEA